MEFFVCPGNPLKMARFVRYIHQQMERAGLARLYVAYSPDHQTEAEFMMNLLGGIEVINLGTQDDLRFVNGPRIVGNAVAEVDARRASTRGESALMIVASTATIEIGIQDWTGCLWIDTSILSVADGFVIRTFDDDRSGVISDSSVRFEVFQP